MLYLTVVTVVASLLFHSPCTAHEVPRQIVGLPTATTTVFNGFGTVETSTSSLHLNTTGDLPATASSCLLSSAAWSLANASWYSTPSNIQTAVVFETEKRRTWTRTAVLGSLISSVPTAFTTCNHFPYARGGTLLANVTSTETVTDWLLATTTPFPTPAPDCSVTLDGQQCSQWWTSHYSCTRTLSYRAYPYGTDSVCSLYYSTEGAPCTEPANLGRIKDRYYNCARCYVSARAAQLHYWPVTFKEGADLCSSGSTINNTEPRTATLYGTPVVYPDVALVFEDLQGSDFCADIGTAVPSAVITLPASAVSTAWQDYRYYEEVDKDIKPIDYADLPPGAPSWNKWLRGQSNCGQYILANGGLDWEQLSLDSSCATVLVDQFAPSIIASATSSLTNFQPAWESNSCAFEMNWLPPKPFVPADGPVPTSFTLPASVSARPTELRFPPAQATQLPSGGLSFLASTAVTMYVDSNIGNRVVVDYGNDNTTTLYPFGPFVISPGAVLSQLATTWAAPESPTLRVTYQPGTGVPRHWSGSASVQSELGYVSYCAVTLATFVGLLAFAL